MQRIVMKDRFGPKGDVDYIDILDRVLDKGILIDALMRVSIAGIHLISVEARVVVASIETYLTHADAVRWSRVALERR